MAEDYKHIDQIIRQKFENFEPEPPVQAWEKIRSEIGRTPPPPHSPGILLPIIVSVSLLIFIAGLFHQLYNGNSENAPIAGSGELTIHSASLGSTGSTSISDNTLQEEFYQTPSAMPHPEIKPVTAAQPAVTPVKVREPFNGQITGEKNKKKKNTGAAGQNTTLSGNRSGEYRPGLVQALRSGDLTYEDAVKYNLNMRDFRKLSSYRENSRSLSATWSAGVYFNPEACISADETIDNTMSYNIGIMPRMSFGHFFLQSGINARFTHDRGNMTVDYNRFLGSYEDVYLVTFDTVDNVVVPTYYTETVDVYDTISQYAVSETRANYTYLEIPVLFGYRYSFGRFALFANAGPAASFMLNKKLPGAGSPEENARIVHVDYMVPSRATINWQLMLGAGFDYQLADRIHFSLEPTLRFALNPEYNMPDINGKTRSFGVRAGINYKF